MRKSLKGLFVGLAILGLAFALVACEGKAGAEKAEAAPQEFDIAKIKVALCAPGLNHPFFQEVANYFEAEAKRMGVQYTILDAQLDTNRQIATVEDLITQKVDMIFLIPTDGTALGSAVLKANDAGIPVITVSRNVTEGKIVAFVGSDDLVIGMTAGNYIATKLGGKGRVVEISGTPGTTTAQDRSKGFNMVMATYPQIKVIASQTANYHRGQAMSVMENIIQAHDQFDAIFAANDEMAGGVLQALKGAGRKGVILVGCNTQADAMEAIKAGDMHADITFPPQAGREALQIGVAYLKGEPYVPYKMIPVELVTKENIEAFASATY